MYTHIYEEIIEKIIKIGEIMGLARTTRNNSHMAINQITHIIIGNIVLLKYFTVPSLQS